MFVCATKSLYRIEKKRLRKLPITEFKKKNTSNNKSLFILIKFSVCNNFSQIDNNLYCFFFVSGIFKINC